MALLLIALMALGMACTNPTGTLTPPSQSISSASGTFPLEIDGSYLDGSTLAWTNPSGVTSTLTASTDTATQIIVNVPNSTVAGTATLTIANANGTSTFPFYFTRTGVQITGVNSAVIEDPSTSYDVAVCNPGTSYCLNAIASGGLGTISIARYTGDPVAAAPPTGVNSFFDVNAQPPATGAPMTSVQVTDCDINTTVSGTAVVYWYDGTAWQPISPAPAVDGAGCATFDITPSSVPSIIQLAGTPFAAGRCDKPGNGNGDRNHVHCGPPGQTR